MVNVGNNVLVENLIDMTTYLNDVAATDPLSAALLAGGTLLFLVSFGVFGYLVLGAAADLVIPDTFSEAPPRHD